MSRVHCYTFYIPWCTTSVYSKVIYIDVFSDERIEEFFFMQILFYAFLIKGNYSGLIWGLSHELKVLPFKALADWL